MIRGQYRLQSRFESHLGYKAPRRDGKLGSRPTAFVSRFIWWGIGAVTLFTFAAITALDPLQRLFLAIAVIVVVLFFAVSASSRDRFDRDPRGLWVAFGATYAIAATGLMFKLPILPYCATAVLILLSARYPLSTSRRASIPLTLIAVYLFVGSLVGRVIFGNEGNGLALGCALVLAALAQLPHMKSGSLQTKYLLRILLTGGMCFAVVGLLANYSALGSVLDVAWFRHTRLEYLAGGIIASIALRRWFLSFFQITTAWVLFAIYPSATGLIAYGILCLALIFNRSTKLGVVAASMVTCVFAWISASGSTALRDLSEELFSRLGKTSNDNTRLELLRRGWSEFHEHPWLGSGFTGNTSIRVSKQLTSGMLNVPLHNDYLQLMVAGGIIAIAIFVVFLMVHANRFLGYWSTTEGLDRYTYTGVACAWTIMLASAAINPVLFNGSDALTFSVIYIFSISLMKGNLTPVYTARVAKSRLPLL